MSSVSSKQSGQTEEFTGWRKNVWPIHNHELKKFLPMGLMMFCVLFIYTVLRDTKDGLVGCAPGAGPESFSFIKGIGVTICAVVFMLLYAKAANIFKREGLFYVTALPFLIFFGAFAFVIYPLKDSLHMSLDSIHAYQAQYPYIKHIVPLVGNWTFSLFYILAELWGSAVLSLLFWQFANAITPIKEAKRFYGMFGFLGNFGLIFSGPLVMYFSTFGERMGLSKDAGWALSLKYLMGMVVVAGAILIYTFYWMNRNVLTDKRYYDPEAMGEGKKGKKPKLSMMESLKVIGTSPYLGLVAMLVLGYGIAINIFEGVWKGYIKILFPHESDFTQVMGGLATLTGVMSCLFMLIGSNILRRFKWKSVASLTPVVLLVGSLIFFGVVIYNNTQFPSGMKINEALKKGIIDRNLILFAIYLGMIVNAFVKAVKYSLFDPTKEMAYIPLDQELKVKGKAAVDVIGGRGGKSLGSWTQMGLLTVTGSFLYQLAPIFAPIAIGIVVLWIFSIFKLSPKYEKARADMEQQAAEAKKSVQTEGA